MLNVDDKNTGKEDKMETFILVRTLPIGRLAFLPHVVVLPFRASSDGGTLQSETSKYLYLLFSGDTLLPLEGLSVFLSFGTTTCADAQRFF